MSQPTARHFAPAYVLRSFEAASDEQHASAAQTTAKDEKGVNVYRVDQGRLLLHTDPDSITPKARLDDLYVDPGHAAFKPLEKSISQLEADALGVVRTIVYSISKSKPNVQITRRALNTLHRFLFVMWCRHTDRGAQLIYGPHDERTKQALDNHIARNFSGKPATPLDVWLQNLRELLDDKLANVFTNEKIFLPDRQAFEADMRRGRLALWRSAPDVDFITALNCCGLYDGWPADGGVGDVFTVHGRAVLARAKVFPLHPNLALAILHPSLTNGGVSPAMYDTLLSRGSSPFADFPAFAPDVRYANLSPAARKAQRVGDTKALESGGKKVAAGAVEGARRIDGRLLEAREDDMLTFAPAHLSARQTLLVNALVLHTASGGVVFRSPRQLHHALSAYSKDFPTWGPKQDYSRLQELLRLYEQGKPLPEDLALPEPERQPATPEPMSPPMSPASSRPGSPLPGRKSVRQRRREREERKLMRQALGIASPPMSSPALSELDLPDDSVIGSPMSDPATLVEASPVLKSIEAALETEIPPIKPLDAEKEPEDEQVQENHIEQPVPLEAIVEEEDAPPEYSAPEPEEVTRPELPAAEPEEVARVESPVADARPESPEPEVEVHEVASLPTGIHAPQSLPLGDVFPEEEAKAVLREALGHAAVDRLEAEQEQHETPHVPETTDEPESPTEEEEGHGEQDDLTSHEDAPAEIMAYVPPVFDAAEHEAVARASVDSEDPFDDSHAVHDHDHDEQEGSHARAIAHTLHRPASPPPPVPFRAGHQRSPPLTPLDLEALVGKVHAVYDMANAVNQAGAKVARDLTDVASIAVVRRADDVLVPVDDDEALETASTAGRSVWTSGGSEGAIPDIEITPVAHSQTSEEEPPPRITVTPPTPALRPLPEVEVEVEVKVEVGAEMRQRVAVAESEKPATNEKQQTSEKDAGKGAVQPYTLTQKVIVWMVLLFLIMFAFPFIVLRTAFNVVMAHRRDAEDGAAGQQPPAVAGTGGSNLNEL
ncbi:hypothetical protein AURDEDRAFT_112199 [Auricularia subglabra TFB-10046 SS5]|nr:hypothetical protein AURDEDRAFT_112199 [Auricularia subglabra TFB-10046 SS5]